MKFEKDEVIGIVGGMGPQAGLALYNSILRHTRATTDQQHLSVILMSFPGLIADRTLYLEGAVSTNPAFTILNLIRKLEDAGATVAGIACNTAHAPPIYGVIADELHKARSGIKLLNMPLETCLYIRENHPRIRRIGLMTTNGTYKAGVYKNLLQEWGYEVVIPDFSFQDRVVHRMIYDPRAGIKANPNAITHEVRRLASEALAFFSERRSDAIILGCTELSLLFTEKTVDGMLVVDSTEALAQALVREATGRVRREAYGLAGIQRHEDIVSL